MKATLITLLAIAAAAVGFFVGRSTTADSSNPRETPGRSATVSALEGANDRGAAANERNREADLPDFLKSMPAPTVENLKKLYDQSRSGRRDLQFRLSVLELDADQLREVWDHAISRSGFTDWEEGEMARALLNRWAELDPIAALDVASGLNGWIKQSGIQEIIRNWTRSDPAKAIAWIRNEASPSARKEAMGAYVAELGKTDRGAAFALFKENIADGTMEPGHWNNGRFFGDWAREDPPAAAAAALSLSESTHTRQALRQVMDNWARKEPSKALKWLGDNASGEKSREMFGAVLGGWARTEPAKAAMFLGAITDKKKFESGIHGVLGQWGGQDFDAATAWIGKLGTPEFQTIARRALIDSQRWGGDSTRAMEYGLQFIDDRKIRDTLMQNAWGMVSQDPNGAVEWVREKIENPEYRADFQRRITEIMGHQSPSLAAELLTGLPDDVRRRQLYDRIGSNWAARDLEAARAWVNELPDGADRDRALEGVTGRWLSDNTAAAAEWIGTLEEGDLRDRLVNRYTIHLTGEREFTTAIEQATGIQNPHQRDQSLESIYRRLLRETPDSAREQIANDPSLSPNTRWRLLSQ